MASEVDFVVGAPITDRADEMLPQPPGAVGAIAQRRALAGGAVVLAALALVARSVTGHSGQPQAGSAAPSGSASLVVSAAPRPLPVGGGIFQEVNPGPQPAGCPVEATCSVVTGLPDPAMDALTRAFPGSVLTVGSSLLAQRWGRFGPDLVSRTFRAHAGSTEITVHIIKPAAGAQPISSSGRHYSRVRTITSLEQSVPGFVVAVDVSQPAGSPPIAYDYLVQLANDDGLVAAQ